MFGPFVLAAQATACKCVHRAERFVDKFHSLLHSKYSKAVQLKAKQEKNSKSCTYVCMFLGKLPPTEALYMECSHYISCLEENTHMMHTYDVYVYVAELMSQQRTLQFAPVKHVHLHSNANGCTITVDIIIQYNEYL